MQNNSLAIDSIYVGDCTLALNLIVNMWTLKTNGF